MKDNHFIYRFLVKGLRQLSSTFGKLGLSELSAALDRRSFKQETTVVPAIGKNGHRNKEVEMIKKTIQWGALLTAIGMAVAAIAFIVKLQADVENHFKNHSAQEDRLAAIEAKIEALSKRDLDTFPPSSGEPCASAKIVALITKTGGVRAMTRISWTPAHCKMVVQGYRDEVLVNEFQKVPQESGAVTLGQAVTRRDGTMNIGMTELKIWVPGSRMPAHEGVWVKVIR